MKAVEIANHRGVSRAYISQLKKRHDDFDPAKFSSLEEVDAWFARNGSGNPLLKRSKTKEEEPEHKQEKSAPQPTPAPTPPISAPPPTPVPQPVELPVIVGGTMEDRALRMTEYVLDSAFQLLQQAKERAAEKPELYAFALKNFADAEKSARGSAERWLDIQQTSRSLISIADLQAAIGPELAYVRRQLRSLPDACAVEANPSDPKKAKAVIQEALDKIMTSIDTAFLRGSKPPREED